VTPVDRPLVVTGCRPLRVSPPSTVRRQKMMSVKQLRNLVTHNGYGYGHGFVSGWLTNLVLDVT